MITFFNVSKKYGNKVIFDNVNFCIKGCGVFLVKGDSGVGKTTLLNIIAGIESYKGKITCSKNTIISYVFQNNYLIEHMNVKEHLDLYGISYKILSKYGLNEKMESGVDKLSCGEKARLAILIGLYKDSNLILMDEPTTNLDKSNAKVVMDDVLKMGKQKIIILVCHEWKNIINKVDGLIKLKDKCITINIWKNREIAKEKIVKTKINGQYLKKEWMYYKKSNISILVCYFLLQIIVFSNICTEAFFSNSISEDIDNSIDYNKFYLSKCEEKNLNGVVVKNCVNLNESDLILLKNENINYGYNYDYILLSIYNRNDLFVMSSKDIKLAKGRYPNSYFEVVASSNYELGEEIVLDSNLVVSDKYIDVYKKTISVKVVGIYHKLNFLDDNNIYFDYEKCEEYFNKEILINNEYSLFDYIMRKTNVFI